MGRPPHLYPGDTQTMCLTLRIADLVFDRPGAYSWEILIDETPVKSLPMRVMAINPGMAPVFGR